MDTLYFITQAHRVYGVYEDSHEAIDTAERDFNGLVQIEVWKKDEKGWKFSQLLRKKQPEPILTPYGYV